MTQADSSQPRERTIGVAGLELAALEWGWDGGRHVLALHGWLDNAASWVAVGPALAKAGCHVVALDLPGHGRSQHRGPDGWYAFLDFVIASVGAAESLGWDRLSLLGHSMGGAVAAVTAGVLGERVDRVALVEGLAPFATSDEDTRDQLVLGLRSLKRHSSAENRVYASMDAIEARIAARPWPIAATSVASLAARGARSVEGGFAFTHDPRLKAESLVRLTPGQVRSFFGGITAPVCLVLAEHGIPYSSDQVASYAALVPSLERHTVRGHHHVHLDAPELVLDWVRPFLCSHRVP